jgi:hypothetical protein
MSEVCLSKIYVEWNRSCVCLSICLFPIVTTVLHLESSNFGYKDFVSSRSMVEIYDSLPGSAVIESWTWPSPFFCKFSQNWDVGVIGHADTQNSSKTTFKIKRQPQNATIFLLFILWAIFCNLSLSQRFVFELFLNLSDARKTWAWAKAK